MKICRSYTTFTVFRCTLLYEFATGSFQLDVDKTSTRNQGCKSANPDFTLPPKLILLSHIHYRIFSAALEIYSKTVKSLQF